MQKILFSLLFIFLSQSVYATIAVRLLGPKTQVYMWHVFEIDHGRFVASYCPDPAIELSYEACGRNHFKLRDVQAIYNHTKWSAIGELPEVNKTVTRLTLEGIRMNQTIEDMLSRETSSEEIENAKKNLKQAREDLVKAEKVVSDLTVELSAIERDLARGEDAELRAQMVRIRAAYDKAREDRYHIMDKNAQLQDQLFKLDGQLTDQITFDAFVAQRTALWQDLGRLTKKQNELEKRGSALARVFSLISQSNGVTIRFPMDPVKYAAENEIVVMITDAIGRPDTYVDNQGFVMSATCRRDQAQVFCRLADSQVQFDSNFTEARDKLYARFTAYERKADFSNYRERCEPSGTWNYFDIRAWWMFIREGKFTVSEFEKLEKLPPEGGSASYKLVFTPDYYCKII